MASRSEDQSESSLLLPRSRNIAQRGQKDGQDSQESLRLRHSHVLTQIAAGAFGFGSRIKSKDLKWSDWQRQQIEGDNLVLPLMIITFSCALADAITLERYSTFATSMTGNTVLLAVRMMGTTDKSPLMAGVSLAGFILSGLLFGQLGARIGHKRRGWLLFSFGSQAAFIVANLILVAPGISRIFRPEGELGWIYLLLLAIQGGIQVTQAANSGAKEIPTAMMTTPYAALISDPALFASANSSLDARSRNRRIVYIVLFWLGSFAGAGLSMKTNIFVVTFVVLVCKIMALVCVVFAEGSSSDGQMYLSV